MSSPHGTVLVVDDLDSNIRLLDRVLRSEGYQVHAARDGEEAVAFVLRERPDVVLMDVRMPRVDGFEACTALKSTAETRLIPIVLMTGAAERADRIRAIEAGADDFLTKPIDPTELKARVRSLVRLKRYTDELDSAESVILSLAQTIEARDPHTEGHCHRLATYAVALGRRLGLDDDDITALHHGGYLHDIGKIAIRDAILLKPGPLSREEFEQIKLHTVVGERLCGGLRAFRRVRPIVRSHHELLDGSGYPDGLSGDRIPRLAQIIGVADVYDALTSWRPYKEPLTVEDAFRQLRIEVDRGWRSAEFVDELDAALQSEPLRSAGKLLA